MITKLAINQKDKDISKEDKLKNINNFYPKAYTSYILLEKIRRLEMKDVKFYVSDLVLNEIISGIVENFDFERNVLKYGTGGRNSLRTDIVIYNKPQNKLSKKDLIILWHILNGLQHQYINNKSITNSKKKINIMENTIITNFEHPPIPIRQYDWSAVRNSYDEGDLIG